MVAEGPIFFQGFFNEPRFGDFVIFVEELEPCFPKRFASHRGEGFAFAKHFSPGNYVAF
jgi:hypothetical protein